MLNFLKKNKTIELISPITGKIIPIEEVPDKVFSQKMVGDGIAIEPSEGKVLSPVDGTVLTIFPTNHAIGLTTKEGIEILIHIGLDTVELGGKGLNRLVEEGTKVKRGDLLMEFDINVIKENGKPIVTPVIISNMNNIKKLKKMGGNVEKGKDIILAVELV